MANVPDPTLRAFAEFEDQLLEDLGRRREAHLTGKPRGPTSSFVGLDEALDGCLEPGVLTLHGQPGSGKTSLAAQIAADCGFPALYVTCEIEPLELIRRQVARVCKVNRRGIFSGRDDPAKEMDRFYRTAEARPGFCILDARVEPAPADYIARSMLVVQGTADHALLVIDSFHTWAGALADVRTPETEYLGRAMNEIRGVCIERNFPAILLSERNRMAMEKGGMSAGAGSRKIEYQSDVLLELAYPKDDEDGNKSRVGGVSKLELRILKNRFGPPGGIIDLRFSGATMSFKEARLEVPSWQ